MTGHAAPKYDVWGITGNGEALRHPTGFETVPTDNMLYGWAWRKDLAFVVRWYPTRKAWLVHDTRSVQWSSKFAGRKYRQISGGIRMTDTYPTVDAALMALIHRNTWPQPLRRAN